MEPLVMDSTAIHVVEGPIAAGKSTATKEYAQTLGFKCVLEDMPGELLVDGFCTTPMTWGSGTQIHAMYHRWFALKLMTMEQPNPPKGVVLDRSAPGDFCLFFANILLGTIDSMPLRALSIYMKRWKALGLTKLVNHVSRFMYLDVNPFTTLQRLGVRGTGETQELPYHDTVDIVYFYMMLALATDHSVGVYEWESRNNKWRSLSMEEFRPCRVVLMDANDPLDELIPRGVKVVHCVPQMNAMQTTGDTIGVFDMAEYRQKGGFHGRSIRRAVYHVMEHCDMLYVRVPHLDAMVANGKSLFGLLATKPYNELATNHDCAIPRTPDALMGLICAMLA